MIKRIKFTVIIAAMALAVSVFSLDTAEAQSSKVGGVDLQTILDSSLAGQEALKELKAKADKEREVLQGKQDEMKKLEKEMEQQRLMLSPKALAEKDRKYRRLKRELELYKEDVQYTLQGAQAQVMRKLLKDVLDIIREYGKKNGYTMILEKGEAANALGGFVLYMDSAVDLTPEIIKIFDERYKSGEIKAE